MTDDKRAGAAGDGVPPLTARPSVQGRYVRAWAVEPAGVVTWFPPNSVFTDDDSQLLHEHFSPERMRALFGPEATFLFLHDWRGLASYESKVRAIQVAWARSFARAQCRAFRICVPDNASPFLLMSISAGRAALELAGYRIEIIDEFQDALDEFDVSPLADA